jgi:hypothetical protein
MVKRVNNRALRWLVDRATGSVYQARNTTLLADTRRSPQCNPLESNGAPWPCGAHPAGVPRGRPIWEVDAEGRPALEMHVIVTRWPFWRVGKGPGLCAESHARAATQASPRDSHLPATRLWDVEDRETGAGAEKPLSSNVLDTQGQNSRERPSAWPQFVRLPDVGGVGVLEADDRIRAVKMLRSLTRYAGPLEGSWTRRTNTAEA